MQHFLPALIVLSICPLAGCETVSTTAPGAIGVERKQVMWVSEADVEQSATQVYALEMTKARQAGQLNAHPAQTERGRAIAGRVIRPTAPLRPPAAGCGSGGHM